MGSLTLETLMDMGMSLEDILFNKEPVQVDVSINTDNLVSAVEGSQKGNKAAIDELVKSMAVSNKFNSELLVKALSLVIKQVNTAASPNQVDQREITGLKMIRNKNTNLLENIKIIRD